MVKSSHLVYVFFDPTVGRLHDGAHHLGVAADDQRLVGRVGVDADPTLTDHGVRRCPALPHGVSIRLKLTGVGGLEDGGDS